MKTKEKDRFKKLAESVSAGGRVRSMRRFIQHGRVNTYKHCLSVAMLAYSMDHFFHIHSSEEELVRGALLHDYYLYDWHEKDRERPLHGPYHPKAALKNALEDFPDLSEKEQNIIAAHMWPLAPTRIPKSREAVLVCVADKIVSARETLFDR